MSQVGNSCIYKVNENLSGVSSEDLEDQKSVDSKEIPLFTLVKNTPVYMEFEKIESPILENYPQSTSSSQNSFEQAEKESSSLGVSQFREEFEENASVLTEYSINSFISVTEAFEEDFYNLGDYETTPENLSKKTKKRRKKCVLL